MITNVDPIAASVLVISDDSELGGLVAINLRRRGYLVEHTDVSLALAERWEPSFGQPDLLIVDVELAGRVSRSQLRSLVDRPWAHGTPLLLATENPRSLAMLLEEPAVAMIARPDDVGKIVATARAILDHRSPRTSDGEMGDVTSVPFR